MYVCVCVCLCVCVCVCIYILSLCKREIVPKVFLFSLLTQNISMTTTYVYIYK